MIKIKGFPILSAMNTCQQRVLEQNLANGKVRQLGAIVDGGGLDFQAAVDEAKLLDGYDTVVVGRTPTGHKIAFLCR